MKRRCSAADWGLAKERVHNQGTGLREESLVELECTNPQHPDLVQQAPQEATPTTMAQEWSTDDVQLWLQIFTFGTKYSDAFRENDVDGKTLIFDIDERILGEDLGVKNRLHRKRILREIKYLKQEQATELESDETTQTIKCDDSISDGNITQTLCTVNSPRNEIDGASSTTGSLEICVQAETIGTTDGDQGQDSPPETSRQNCENVGATRNDISDGTNIPDSSEPCGDIMLAVTDKNSGSSIKESDIAGAGTGLEPEKSASVSIQIEKNETSGAAKVENNENLAATPNPEPAAVVEQTPFQQIKSALGSMCVCGSDSVAIQVDQLLVVDRNLNRESNIERVVKKVEWWNDVKITKTPKTFEIRGPIKTNLDDAAKMLTEKLEAQYELSKFKYKAVGLPPTIYSTMFMLDFAHENSALARFGKNKCLSNLLWIVNIFCQIAAIAYIGSDLEIGCSRQWLVDHWQVYTLSIVIFITVCMNDFFETLQMCLLLHFMPDRDTKWNIDPDWVKLTAEHCHNNNLDYRRMFSKSNAYIMVIIPKLVICFLVMAIGTRFLISDRDKESNVLVNALTLLFIMEIDEIMYRVFIPEYVRNAIANITPIPVEGSKDLTWWHMFPYPLCCVPYPHPIKVMYRLAFGMWTKVFSVAAIVLWVTFYFAVGDC
eukprot:240015_1